MVSFLQVCNVEVYMNKSIMLSLAIFPLIANSSDFKSPNYSSSIEYPFYEVQKEEDGYKNQMMILNSGINAFAKRIELIRKAKKNIEVEYFIYALDETAKAMTTELVKAAKRGVNVRVLIDKSAAVFVLDEFYAQALRNAGVEIKYYNAAAIYRLSSINFRNHRKLLSVDDKYAITGGRNIENDYFDYSEEFNFLDRDVLIHGDIVKTLRKSFDEYFNHKISEVPEAPKAPKKLIRKRYKENGSVVWKYKNVPNTKRIQEYKKKQENAELFIKQTTDDATLISKYLAAAKNSIDRKNMYSCPVVTYSTDRPGGNFATRLKEDYSDDYRYLRKTLFDKAVTVDKGILVSSPYMINSPKSLEIYNALLDRDVSIKLYTNSMASTDALYVAANLYRSVFEWSRLGIETYIHAGEYINENDPKIVNVEKAKWGTHSKTQLYIYKDSSMNEFMIGTYNYDNRSNHYNTEMGIFCQGSKILFDDVQNSIAKRMNKSYLIHSDYSATDKDGNEVSVFGANKDDLLKMTLMALPSWLLNLLL